MDSGYQINFFGDTKRQERWESIESCVDVLRKRFGAKAITRATLLKADIIGESDPLTHDVHPVAFFR
jgi:DNA polymerase-4